MRPRCNKSEITNKQKYTCNLSVALTICILMVTEKDIYICGWWWREKTRMKPERELFASEFYGLWKILAIVWNPSKVVSPSLKQESDFQSYGLASGCNLLRAISRWYSGAEILRNASSEGKFPLGTDRNRKVRKVKVAEFYSRHLQWDSARERTPVRRSHTILEHPLVRRSPRESDWSRGGSRQTSRREKSRKITSSGLLAKTPLTNE